MDAIAGLPHMLAAVVYDSDAYPDAIFMQVVVRCRSAGAALAGIVQRRLSDVDHRCDMLLVNLATGEQTSIFADRGRDARGCHLNSNAMLQVVTQIGQDLAQSPKLLVLNKFGKVEAEGAGMRDLLPRQSSMPFRSLSVSPAAIWMLGAILREISRLNCMSQRMCRTRCPRRSFIQTLRARPSTCRGRKYEWLPLETASADV